MSGIVHLHGVAPKPSRLIKSDKPLRGTGIASLTKHQHDIIGFYGTTYNSPFTESAGNVHPTGVSTATQPQLPAIQAEGAGNPVPTKHFVKIQPHEKGSTFATTSTRPLTPYRAGGPSKLADTPASPNHPNSRKKAPPKVTPASKVARRSFLPSFLKTGGTLSGHATASTNHSTPRWNVTKTGAAG